MMVFSLKRDTIKITENKKKWGIYDNYIYCKDKMRNRKNATIFRRSRKKLSGGLTTF